MLLSSVSCCYSEADVEMNYWKKKTIKNVNVIHLMSNSFKFIFLYTTQCVHIVLLLYTVVLFDPIAL